jgi:mannosyltransferase OCH1-like enzyme
MIPKIIHQLAPTEDKWHPIWKICYPTWKTHYPDFVHKMWGDKDIDIFVEEYFPKHYNVYKTFTTHIFKLDFVRLAFLYQFGGIYADMDMYCYKNFYSELIADVNLIQSNGIKNINCNEHVQNSLMAASAKNKFFLECIDELCDRYMEREQSVVYAYANRNLIPTLKHFYSECVLQISGPVLLSDIYEKYSDTINVLPRELYNDSIHEYKENYRTKHMMTGLWGKEAIEQNQDLTEQYKNFRGIDLKDYKFE